MTIRIDNDEIWYWYQKIEEYYESGMGRKDYCDEYKVDYIKFSNVKYRIEYKRLSDPELYSKLLPLCRKYINSGISASRFSQENNIHPRILSEMVTHLGYIDVIESMKESKGIKPMHFIQVPTNGSVTIPSGYNNEVPVMNLPMITKPDTEVIEKKNDIEIVITKGVKVSISPAIDSMKIIKIIELLKDL